MANDQKLYQTEADALFPAGCKCGNNGGGDCDWCRVYYNGPEYEGCALGCTFTDCSGVKGQ
jgi:hypothetical protein